jgi:hypothetical protein
MTTIQEFSQKEVLSPASPLINELLERNCLDDDIQYQLTQGPLDKEALLNELEVNKVSVFKVLCDHDGKEYYGIKHEHGKWLVDPIYDNDLHAIAEWFELYQGDQFYSYSREIFEYYVVSDYLAQKLRDRGEQVVSFFELDIWCRTVTGQAIHADHVINEIYNDFIS